MFNHFTTFQHGGLDLQSILQEEEFAYLKKDPQFLEFLEGIK